jgi:hypothetical protein
LTSASLPLNILLKPPSSSSTTSPTNQPSYIHLPQPTYQPRNNINTKHHPHYALGLTTSVAAVDNARVTYYDNQDASNMNFGACEQPVGTLAAPYGAAMSLADNGNKQACGKCINVHYGGKSVKVQVRCPSTLVKIEERGGGRWWVIGIVLDD